MECQRGEDVEEKKSALLSAKAGSSVCYCLFFVSIVLCVYVLVTCCALRVANLQKKVLTGLECVERGRGYDGINL